MRLSHSRETPIDSCCLGGSLPSGAMPGSVSRSKLAPNTARVHSPTSSGMRNLGRKNGPHRLRWQGAGAARPTPVRTHRRLEMLLTIPAGQHHDLILEIAPAGLPAELAEPDGAWRSSEAAWKQAVPQLDNCLSPRDARHSYAVWRGPTSSGGGMVAAATTSLPERAEAGRNYDYRYVWIRDQCYAGHALAAAETSGFSQTVFDSSQNGFSTTVPAWHRPTPRSGPECRTTRTWSPRISGGFDRIGNWVNGQFQLDAFGEALLLFADAAGSDLIDDTAWRAAEITVDAIARRWGEPDAGIWEIDNQAWTPSRRTAAGLRAISNIRSVAGPHPDWLALADRILADTASGATHPAGYWQRSPGDEGLDGSLLLPALRGAVPADDPRTCATQGLLP